MVEDAPQHPSGNALWRVLSTYAFVPLLWSEDERPERVPRSPSPDADAELPSEQRKALAWIESASVPLASLADAKTARRALDRLRVTQDGSKAAESYFRSGAVCWSTSSATPSNQANPLAKLNEKVPKKSGPFDKSVVLNPAQAADMLAAISYVGSYHQARGRRFVVLFAMLFYAMLRPEEALFVHDYDCTLPAESDAWGSIRLTQTRPTAGRRWTDTGRIHDERGGIPVAWTYTRVWREVRPLAPNPGAAGQRLR